MAHNVPVLILSLSIKPRFVAVQPNHSVTLQAEMSCPSYQSFPPIASGKTSQQQQVMELLVASRSQCAQVLPSLLDYGCEECVHSSHSIWGATATQTIPKQTHPWCERHRQNKEEILQNIQRIFCPSFYFTCIGEKEINSPLRSTKMRDISRYWPGKVDHF